MSANIFDIGRAYPTGSWASGVGLTFGQTKYVKDGRVGAWYVNGDAVAWYNGQLVVVKNGDATNAGDGVASKVGAASGYGVINLGFVDASLEADLAVQPGEGVFVTRFGPCTMLLQGGHTSAKGSELRQSASGTVCVHLQTAAAGGASGLRIGNAAAAATAPADDSAAGHFGSGISGFANVA